MRPKMDRLDWVLAAGVTAAMAVAFGLLIPKFGWLVGASLAVIVLLRAKKRRDEYSAEGDIPEQTDEREN